MLNNPVNWIDSWGLRNLEGTAFATPTPTPVAAIMVCGPARQAECLNRQFVVPPSGGWGIDWGDVVRAYWEYHPYHLTYRYVLAPAWEVLTHSCAIPIEKAGAGVFVGAVGFAARNPLWMQTGGTIFAVNVMNAAEECR